MILSLILDVKNLTISLVFSKTFKIGHHSEVNEYTNYQTKTRVGAIGFGFLTVYYSRTTNY